MFLHLKLAPHMSFQYDNQYGPTSISEACYCTQCSSKRTAYMILMRLASWFFSSRSHQWKGTSCLKDLACPLRNTRRRNFHSDRVQGLQTSIFKSPRVESEFKNRSKHDVEKEGSNVSAASSSWELTVGIEIHAQLNTDRKLFSSEWLGFHESAYLAQTE